jgi:hypothetical protein
MFSIMQTKQTNKQRGGKQSVEKCRFFLFFMQNDSNPRKFIVHVQHLLMWILATKKWISKTITIIQLIRGVELKVQIN